MKISNFEHGGVSFRGLYNRVLIMIAFDSSCHMYQNEGLFKTLQDWFEDAVMKDRIQLR